MQPALGNIFLYFIHMDEFSNQGSKFIQDLNKCCHLLLQTDSMSGCFYPSFMTVITIVVCLMNSLLAPAHILYFPPNIDHIFRSKALCFIGKYT